MAEDVRGLAGRRVLVCIKLPHRETDPYEFQIAEVSPSGRMVKMIDLKGDACWYKTDDVRVYEALEDKPNKQMQELKTIQNKVANDTEFAKGFAYRAECAKKLIDSVFKGEGY